MFFVRRDFTRCLRQPKIDFNRSVPRGFAEWIFNNGKVVTVDKDFSIQESIAIKDGAIVGVGSNAAMRTWRGPKTREIDLGGRTVIPGLIDAQIHATLAGLTWDGEIHWEQVNSLADGLSQIAAAVKQRPAGSWIVVAGGWVPTQFPERRFPTREELDSIAPQHPVYMQYLRQGALLNGAGLVALGITDKTPDPSGGKFEKDANGKLTGWLQGVSGWEFAYNKIPQTDARQNQPKPAQLLSRIESPRPDLGGRRADERGDFRASPPAE